MKGTVFKSTGSHYAVRLENGDDIRCSIKGKLRLAGIKTTNPVAVGDRVEVERGNEREGVIARVLDRDNYIIRKATNLSREAHVLAANIDRAIIVATIRYPETSTVFIDRFLASAEAYGIPPAIIINKIDLLDDEETLLSRALAAIYRAVGYPVIFASALTGQGMDEVAALLAGKVSALAGLSGAGKSTLINRVEPGLHLRTGDLSAAHESGRHTTTFAEMFPLAAGGFIVDTPGIRAFGLVRLKREEISHYFPEIFRVADQCRYYNCTHVHEPGCAVQQAVEAGTISESRYASYVDMFEEQDDKYRR
ncbi:MAG: ribosome small subunit-dependent GTPase A [Odoribacteraceae bacterium]|jgi:ribosome biogenesis GTPase|nr:ribosome small subunit-dependent GTPase A [Odoribacteraceae bacterium]